MTTINQGNLPVKKQITEKLVNIDQLQVNQLIMTMVVESGFFINFTNPEMELIINI